MEIDESRFVANLEQDPKRNQLLEPIPTWVFNVFIWNKLLCTAKRTFPSLFTVSESCAYVVYLTLSLLQP